MNQLSKCCNAEIEIRPHLIGEYISAKDPFCSKCGKRFPSIHNPTPPTSTEVKEIRAKIEKIMRYYMGGWDSHVRSATNDVMNVIEQREAHLIQQAELRGEKRGKMIIYRGLRNIFQADVENDEEVMYEVKDLVENLDNCIAQLTSKEDTNATGND